MAQHARELGISRRAWLLAGLGIPLFRARAGEALTASFDGDNLYPVAPSLHFLSGRVLERLRDSADTQTFFSQVSLFVNGDTKTAIRRAPAHFVVSYSIWEEKFTVSILSPLSLTKGGFSQQEAEHWTLENLAISASGLNPDQPFKLRFDLRAAQPRDLAKLLGNDRLSLRDTLISFFATKAAGDAVMSVESSWMHLRDLPRIFARAPRNG